MFLSMGLNFRVPCKFGILFRRCKTVPFLRRTSLPEDIYRGTDRSLARPGREQAYVPVRMVWISFGALPCRRKTWWQLESRCCWNRARPWHAFELVSFLVGLRTYQHSGSQLKWNQNHFVVKGSTCALFHVLRNVCMFVCLYVSVWYSCKWTQESDVFLCY